MSEPFDLARFVVAQAPVYARVVAELRSGHKRSHWMWFVFPQIDGLGHSAMARRYAIRSLEEAKAYLAHEILGPRLRECTALVNAVKGRAIAEIFGYPDDLKFHSSMTLFLSASGNEAVFAAAIEKYFAGARDGATLEKLG
jgi:uncharacterized protein (DUF1810 family)